MNDVINYDRKCQYLISGLDMSTKSNEIEIKNQSCYLYAFGNENIEPKIKNKKQ